MSLNGYIEGLGSGAARIVRKTGKEIKLSAYDNIDRVIVFNEAGETSQETNDGRNLFDINLLDKTNITIDGNEASATATNFHTNFQTGVFPSSLPNNQYALSFKAYTDGNQSTSGAGLLFGFIYTDNTRNYVTIQNSITSYESFSIVSNNGKTVSNVLISYATSGGNIWHLKDIQLEVGSTATPYQPYCGGIPSPNPDYPQAVEGIGVKQLDGSYTVSIDYYDDERDERITASGLAYPLYEGDILDFVNSKVIRSKACLDLSTINWSNNGSFSNVFNGTLTEALRAKITTDILCNRYKYETSSTVGANDFGIAVSANRYYIYVHDSNFSQASDFKTWLQNNETLAVYSLNTPVEEYITIEGGDIADIGTARVMADGTLTVKYDKAEMAVRKYSAKPDWQKIGYTDTPQIILDAFDYSKRIYDTWTPSASYASAYRGDKELKFFPDVDLTGATNYSAMFQESGIQFTEPLTIGDDSNTAVNCQWMFQSSPIEDIEITNESESQGNTLTNIFNGCSLLKKAKLNLLASGSMQNAFADCTRLERIEGDFDTSSVTSIQEAFRACAKLNFIYELDLASCTSCYRAFQGCTSLEYAPIMTLTSATNLQQMFWNCSSLKSVSFYNIPRATNLTNMFQGTGSNLTEDSRNRILMTLASATAYTGTKTLAQVGFNSSMYSASSWQALSKYADFVDAGWSIGYT